MPKNPSAPGYLPEGYKESKKRWRVDGPPGADNYQVEHWSGRLDAEVNPKPVKVRVKVEER